MARTNAEDTMEPTEDMLAAKYDRQNQEGSAPNNIAGAQGSPSTSYTAAIPGLMVDQTKFVVLASRLGRPQEPLPKHNPNDPNEATVYAVPDPWERGDLIDLDSIWQDPNGKIDNLQRLLRTGAIGRLDHPDARGAMEGLQYRRSREEAVQQDRGVISR